MDQNIAGGSLNFNTFDPIYGGLPNVARRVYFLSQMKDVELLDGKNKQTDFTRPLTGEH